MTTDNSEHGLRPISLRSSLLVLVFVCIVPAVVLSAFLAFNNYHLFKNQLYAETQRLAQLVIDDVDRELSGVESGLRVLATSEALKRGDFRSFHAIAREALKSQIVYNYILTDRDGHQLLNTLVPYGTPLPAAGTPPQLAKVFAEERAALTDFFIGPVTGKPALAMGVPVVGADGKVAYSLNIGLAPGRLNEVLNRQPLAEGWLGALIDASGTIVGRTRDAERFVGQKAVGELFANIVAHRVGVMETFTRDGLPVMTAYARSPTWGWAVAVGAPKQLMETRLNNAVLSIVLTTVLVLAIGTWVAFSIIRRLTRSIEALNAAALAINDGNPVTLPKTQLTEAEAIGRAIVRASELSSEVHHRAYHDTLTGLGNRALFYEFLEKNLARAERDGSGFSLLMLDLDRFKLVNDQEGHAAGDAVLRAVATRIRAEIRAQDLAARLGGDEFAVLLVNTDRDNAREVARRLNFSLATPYAESRTGISASIGIVNWHAGIGSGSMMLEMADKALYQVKARGRNAALEVD